MAFRNKDNAKDAPIGVFDSGIGGLTVLKEISKILPKENIVYFGDTARVPYGTKSKETVVKFSIQDADFLMDMDVKMIVVACNTASSYSLDILKRRYDIPVIGVIEPGAKKAASITRSRKVGVIGTKATVSSGIYEREIKSIHPKVQVTSVSCPLFVSLVEENWLNDKITKDIANIYLKDFKKSGIDTLILGCTHYPLLRSVIQEAVGRGVTLVDSAKETAKEVKRIIIEDSLERIYPNKCEYKFFVSDEPNLFKKIGERFLGHRIDDIGKVEIELREKYVRNNSECNMSSEVRRS